MKKWWILLLVVMGCKNKPEIKYVPLEATGDDLTYYINIERQSKGLTYLVSEAKLNEIAKAKVLQMIATNKLSHDGFVQRFEESKSSSLSENVAHGFISPKGFFLGYMNSEPHKKNILMPKRNYIGSYTQGKYNCVLFAYYQPVTN